MAALAYKGVSKGSIQLGYRRHYLYGMLSHSLMLTKHSKRHPSGRHGGSLLLRSLMGSGEGGAAVSVPQRLGLRAPLPGYTTLHSGALLDRAKDVITDRADVITKLL